MSAGFRVLGVDHVTVTAPQELEEEVVDWYSTCLGLERTTKPEGTRPVGAWFRAGPQEVHVTVDPHNPPKEAHFAIVVDDFDSIVGRLRGAGCHLEQARTIPGRRRCYARDPAGNRIEIITYEEETASVAFEET